MATIPNKRVNGLSKLQLSALDVLRDVGMLGAITRAEIAERIGYLRSYGTYKEVGWPNLERRAKWEATEKRKSLCTLGYVVEVTVHTDSRKDNCVRITPEGLKALKDAEIAKAGRDSSELTK